MGHDHECSHHDEPLTRDDALDLAYNLLITGQEKASGGLIAEAQMLNALAQTAIALAERTVFAKLSGGEPVH